MVTDLLGCGVFRFQIWFFINFGVSNFDLPSASVPVMVRKANLWLPSLYDIRRWRSLRATAKQRLSHEGVQCGFEPMFSRDFRIVPYAAVGV